MTKGWTVKSWLLSVLAAAPFIAIYLIHYAGQLGSPTGFIGYDQPYYMANARAAFERGNGWAYPNPYDPSDASPVIYFHSLLWLLGFCTVWLGADPGTLYASVGVIMALVCSRATLALVDDCLNDPRHRVALFLFTMWGGGVFVLWALLLNWKIGLPAGYDLLRLDPGNGWWLLNWGRNLVYTTEATYHALVAVAWLGVLRHNWRIALAAAAALASTHPYTAVQLLSILGVWCVLRFLAPPPARVPLWFCIAIIALMAGVLSYNLLYLRQFESHRELMKQVTQGWEISVGSLLTSVLPVAFLAIVRIVRDYRNLDERVYFLLICFSVSFLLANHEWFLPPMQPIHFTRGYTWIPLCLIGLPALQDAIAWLHQRINRPAFMEFGIELPKTALIVVCILDWVVRCAPFACMGLILVSDNLAFVWQYKQHRDEYGFYLTPGERDLLEELNRRHLRGILISSDPKLSYLVATYTGARPYYGHLYHTPDYGRRHGEAVALLQQGKPGPWFDRIDLIALRSEQPVMWPDRDQWRLVSSNDEWVLYKRMR